MLVADDIGEEMRTFDELPPAVRQAISFHPFQVSARLVRDNLRAGNPAEMLRTLKLMVASFVRSQNFRWKERYGQPSPHVAADATVLETRPLERRMASYEEDRWPYLSPARRAAVNRLRQARGQQTIPPPKIDLYVAPPPRAIQPVDLNDPALIREVRAHGAALGLQVGRGDEGFELRAGPVVHGADGRGADSRDEGFTLR